MLQKIVVGLLVSALVLVPGPAALVAQEDVLVERVELQGNRYLRAETLTFYISTKAGDRYDELRLKEDFQRLWDTGFLDDMRLEVFDGQTGKIVMFTVGERKRVQIVDYRGSKALTTTEIEEALKEKDAELRIDSFYNESRAKRAEQVILALLKEKGRAFGTVTHEEKTLGGAGTQVSFIVDDGPKTKVKGIVFTGNEIYSDAKLRGRMKKIKQGGFFNMSWLGGKRTYTPEKWAEDQESVRQFYLNNGYVTATVGEPEFKYEDGETGFLKKGPVKWLTVEIPITEGHQYRVGNVEIEGSTIFKDEFILSLFKFKPGDVYSEKKIEKGYEKLRDIYGSAGYIQWTALTKRDPDPERQVVDVVLSMEEDLRYFVGKIIFTGNDSTRDKVIRREVYMTEGDVFNTELLKASIKRVNQLGYFKTMEEMPDIYPSPAKEDHLDVTFEVEEQNRNQFTFGGGVSGLEGTFINASFSTSNFLGLGETFQISAQSGKRTKNYRLAITEPYLFDRPITAGIDLYKRRLEYRTYVEENIQGYVDQRTGASFVTGLPVSRFARAFLNYTYEVVKVDLTDSDEYDFNLYDPTQPSYVPAQYYYYAEQGERTESRLSPSLVYNTVDNPFLPRAGQKLSATMQVAGGVLGGTMDYLRPNLQAITYFPHLKKTSLGMRLELGWIHPYGSTAVVDPETGQNGLPWYQRFYLGGENQVRGFYIRSISPTIEVDGQLRQVGGNKFAVFNAEYYIDFGSMVRFLFFYDAGTVSAEGESLSLKNVYTSTGAELRFMMPVLNVPFRLIYAFNPQRDEFHKASTFKFAVGTTF